MPFLFQWLCNLLDELDRNRHKGRLSISRLQSYEYQIIYNWYQRYSHKLDRTGPSAIAFLSCILPERRPDRVYGLKEKRLSHVFGRALGLGASRAVELNQWLQKDGTDFGTCVELTLQKCENDKPAPGQEVTVEEIDETLDLIAAHSPSSSPTIRARRTNVSATDLLSPILRRLQSGEAKWFARLLLKTYAPIQIPEYQTLHGFHFMLPNLLTVQNSLEAAVAVLATDAIRQLPARPDKNYEYALHSLLSNHIQPRIGVMVRRQPYHKARSIKNCCSLADGRQMSVERKYDGEYCQIHIDMSKGRDCVQIFSKSGKDSTNDRIRLHTTIKDALRIDRNGCRVHVRCIIEGELLVWSSTMKDIQPFHTIRKFVRHGGRDIGTAQDSPPKPGEHLMVAFYDILLLDDQMLLNKPHKVRRQYLKMVLQTTEGQAILGERKVIDFRANRADKKLRELFAEAITNGWEGLVLKGLNEPYFSWNNKNHGIKLKKDYITKLGDTADLCIVGGRRNPHTELQIGLGRLEWTMFYVGAVCNMERLRRFDEKPQIKIIDILTHHSMPKTELLDLNRLGKLVQVEWASNIAEYDVEMDRPGVEKPTDLFKVPFIVEIMGAGFEKLLDSSFFTLRFPRKVDGSVKLHTDRTLVDTSSFQELQEMAARSMAVPEDKDSQEDAMWIERLMKADGKKRLLESMSQGSSAKTPVSTTTMDMLRNNPEKNLSSPIFVRPDTEEPETQTSEKSIVHHIERRELVTKSREVEDNDSPSKSRTQTRRLKRQHIRNLSTISHTDLSHKKQCSQASRPSQSNTTLQEVDVVQDVTNSAEELAVEKTCPGGEVARLVSPKPHSMTESSANVRGQPKEDRLGLTTTASLEPSVTFHDCMDNKAMEGCPTRKLQSETSLRDVEMNEQSFQHHTKTAVSFLPTPSSSSPLATTKIRAERPSVEELHTLATKQSKTQSSTITTMSGSRKDPTNQAQTIGHMISSSIAETTTTVPTPLSVIQRQKPELAEPILILGPQSNVQSPPRRIGTSFTFSPIHFLSHIKACDSMALSENNDSSSSTADYYIILIETLPAEAAAEAFLEMAHQMQAYLLSKANDPLNFKKALKRYKERILVFDIRVLHHETIIADNSNLVTRLDLDTLGRLDFRKGHGRDAALFCGVLEFHERLDNTHALLMEEDKTHEEQGGGSRWNERDLKIRIELVYKFDWLKGN